MEGKMQLQNKRPNNAVPETKEGCVCVCVCVCGGGREKEEYLLG